VIGRAVVGGLLALVLVACGDDGGEADADLVDLLEDEGGQREDVAECVAERVAEDDRVDPDELESIIRGEGSTDTETADAFAEASAACAPD
jgi:hypothetical protein